MFEPLPADLQTAIAASDRLGRLADVRYRAEVGSTNDLALSLAAAGEPEGVSVLADAQSAGRGRRGRDWFSPPGAGLYLSTIVRPGGDADGPAAHAETLPLITLAAGVAAAQAVHATASLPVTLKWPNDLVIGAAWRKLGGVLCEAAGLGGRIDAIVVGIGINVGLAAYPPALAARATSIESELGRPVERTSLIVDLLAALRQWIDTVHRGDAAAICAAWRQLGQDGLGGAPVQWQDGDRVRHGRARDIADDGALLVEVDGRMERLIAGEVLWDRQPER
jgi:BirA family transcriptional regulator, biotin operon repressor / biotin---[acetyl-CoA-carboxylase] ligase